MKRKYLSMAVGCALLAPAAFVQAQEQQHPAGHQQATQLDEVTVTARRRTESIQDVPVAVIVAEYVDIAKAFYSEDEPKLVNAVLDRVSRRVRGEGRGRDAS